MSSSRATRHGGLYYTATGESQVPLVLLHGSLNDHTSWDQVVPILSRHLRVITYDRRGHSRSDGERRRDSIFDDATDLAIMIEEVVGKPAHVAGTSGGAAIALRLACSQPHLFLSLSAHEPPLIDALPSEGQWGDYKNGLNRKFAEFRKLMESGTSAQAAAFFVDSLSDGPGTWNSLPENKRDIFKQNAWTLYHECLDDDFMAPDFEGLTRFDKPIMLTQGAKSAPFFSKIIDLLVERSLPAAIRHTFPSAGHVPHETHPEEYAAALLQFVTAQKPT